MKRPSRFGVLVALVSLALAGAGHAAVINVQFNQIDTPPTPAYPAYTGTGAAPDTGTYWNEVGRPWNGGTFGTVTGTNLKTSDGLTTTGISLLFGDATHGVRNVNFGTGITPNRLLQNGYLNQQTAGTQNIPLVLSGLAPGGQYDLWLYGGGVNTDWDTYFTFGTTRNTLGTAGSATALTIPASDENISFVRFVGLTADVSGTISGTVSGRSAGVPRPLLNGLQLQQVPEPATLAFFALSAVVMLRRRREV